MKKKIGKILAIISLICIALLLIALVFSLITANGKLSMAMIFSIIFVSILVYIALRFAKK